MVCYYRFKDDLLFILRGDMEVRKNWVEGLRARASYFKLALDCTSLNEVVMLDVRVFKGPKWLQTGFLDTSL